MSLPYVDISMFVVLNLTREDADAGEGAGERPWSKDVTKRRRGSMSSGW